MQAIYHSFSTAEVPSSFHSSRHPFINTSLASFLFTSSIKAFKSFLCLHHQSTVHLFVQQFILSSIHPRIHTSTNRSIYLSIYPSIHPSIYLFVYVSAAIYHLFQRCTAFLGQGPQCIIFDALEGWRQSYGLNF